MAEGDGNQTDYSGVNYDSVVENCLSDGVKTTIPESWAKKFKGKSMDDVFKSHLSTEKEISRRVRLPGDETSDEDRRKFHTACGCPETPDGYEFELPDGHDENFVKWARDTFHAAGVNQRKASAIVKGFTEFSGKQVEAAEAAKAEAEALAKRKNDKKIAAAETALRKEWPGEEYETNLAKAKLGYENIFGDKGRKMLADAGLNTNPEIIRAVFAHVDKLGEDAFVKGGRSGSKETPKQMLNRMYPDDPKPKPEG